MSNWHFQTDIQRFVHLFARPHGDDGCWIWVGDVMPKYPYGRFRTATAKDGRRKRVMAYRFAYERFVGPIPKGRDVTLHHRCYNPSCVNPEHLEIMPRSENSSRKRTCLTA